MINEVKVPRVTVNDDFVELLEWHVADGSQVAVGDPLCAVESSKSVFEIEAARGGWVKILVAKGDRFAILDTICLLSDRPEESSDFVREPKTPSGETSDMGATRKARMLARELNVDLGRIRKPGIIREADVRALHLRASGASSTSTQPKPADPTSRETILGAVRWVVWPVLRVSMWVIYRLPLISSWVQMGVRAYPLGKVGRVLREAFYRAGIGYMGPGVRIDTGAMLDDLAAIEIGAGSHIDTNVRIVARKGSGVVRIGKGVHIGPGVLLFGIGGITIGDYAAVTAGSVVYSARNLPEKPESPEKLISMSHAAGSSNMHVVTEAVEIGAYAFVGVNAVVLPGVTVGEGAIVNAAAVVANDVPPRSIYGGQPFGVVGQRRSGGE